MTALLETPLRPARAELGLGAGSDETLTFRVAMAVIALAVIDDAFAHPEPGTNAADHLASGLVPVAVAFGLAVVYPRLRAGARASVAIACGILASIGGVSDGVRHVVVDRLSGDDATAILAALAGAGVIALGLRTLWTTRKQDARRGMRYGRRMVLTAAALAAAMFLILPLGMAILATHKARGPVASADLGRQYERVGFTTSDGYRLAGWYVPSRNGAAVIAFPGRSGPVRHARMLARHGYGVLLFDRRGEGESEGDINLLGWNGEKDLLAAVRYLRTRPDADPQRIGGLGLSVGGELLLQAAAHTTGIRAVVSERAGVRSLAEHLHTPGVGRVQRWLSGWVAQDAALTVLSNHRRPPDLVDLIPRIAPRPVFLIHARQGQGGEQLNPVYYAAARSPKAIWAVPDGGHTGALSARPREYEQRVVGFFERALSVAG